jgi:hypothetical protein
MMAQADPQYMFNNTPLDMSEAARMARAEDAVPAYHGTKSAGLDRFDPAYMKEGLGGRVTYATDTPLIASDYAGGDLPYDEFIENGSGVLPLLLSGSRKAMPAADLAKGEGKYFDNVRGNINTAKDEGFAGMDLQTSQGPKVYTTFNPANIRSRFARFDPEFSHLSNLSAANASAPVGLLAAQPSTEDELRQYLMQRGLLQ